MEAAAYANYEPVLPVARNVFSYNGFLSSGNNDFFVNKALSASYIEKYEPWKDVGSHLGAYLPSKIYLLLFR